MSAGRSWRTHRARLRYDAVLIRKAVLPCALALFVFQARPAEKFSLTVDNIMRGPALVGYPPAQVRWSYDSQRIFFQWKQAGDRRDAPLDTYVVGRDGGPPRKLDDAEAKQAPPFIGDLSRDRRLTVFSRDGDLFLYDASNGQVRQITDTASGTERAGDRTPRRRRFSGRRPPIVCPSPADRDRLARANDRHPGRRFDAGTEAGGRGG